MNKNFRLALVVLLATLVTPICGADELALSRRVAGGRFEYEVRSGDTLSALGARFGVSARALAEDNRIAAPARLRGGERLRVDNRHLVPELWGSDIVINVPQRMLFHFRNDVLEAAYPVGLGRPDWPTPSGHFEVVSREQDKPWIVPKSIQEEMLREGKPVLTYVPPGPDNPLGRHWLGLSFGSLGIHGTIAPSSVYQFRSHGCIRLHPDDVAELFAGVAVGDPGTIIYEPVLAAKSDDGAILLEVHSDVYHKRGDPLTALRALAAAHGFEQEIDWSKAEQVAQEQAGRPQDVSLHAEPSSDR